MTTQISAGGIVYRKVHDDYEWLLVKNTKSDRDYWGFPKGHVGDTVANEKIEAAALREVQEEGGIEAKIIADRPFTVEYMFRLKGQLIKKTVHYFLMEYLSGDPKNHDWEVGDAAFMSEDKMLELLTFKNDSRAFQELKKLL